MCTEWMLACPALPGESLRGHHAPAIASCSGIRSARPHGRWPCQPGLTASVLTDRAMTCQEANRPQLKPEPVMAVPFPVISLPSHSASRAPRPQTRPAAQPEYLCRAALSCFRVSRDGASRRRCRGPVKMSSAQLLVICGAALLGLTRLLLWRVVSWNPRGEEGRWRASCPGAAGKEAGAGAGWAADCGTTVRCAGAVLSWRGCCWPILAGAARGRPGLWADSGQRSGEDVLRLV